MDMPENLEKPADGEELNVNDAAESAACEESEEECAACGGCSEDAAGAEAGQTEQTEQAEQKSELEELKHQLALARADMYNYRQRVERERAKTRKLIIEDKIAEFLPVLDNLDRALCVPESGSAKDVLIGVRMVQRQFLSVLEGSEVTVIPAEGCSFDPLLHDAVETEIAEAPEQDGAVLSELLRGYRTPERVLRPAQVRVAKWNSQGA